MHSTATSTASEYEELLRAKEERDVYRAALRDLRAWAFDNVCTDGTKNPLPMINDEDYLSDICWSDGCLCDAIHPRDIPCIVCQARGEKGRV